MFQIEADRGAICPLGQCPLRDHNGLGGRGRTSAGEADGQLFQPQLEGNGLSIGAVHRACIKV